MNQMLLIIFGQAIAVGHLPPGENVTPKDMVRLFLG
jgi:hypothetical protein